MGLTVDPLRGLPPGWASDVEVLARTGSVVEDHGDHLIVRTVDNPEFRWGNLLVVRDPGSRNATDRWLRRFREAFPTAEHRSIGLPAEPETDPWTAAGLRVETEEVLGSVRPPAPAPLASGYEVRRMGTTADWNGAVELELHDEAAAGRVEPGYRQFAVRRWRARAQASDQHRAAFFAAFAGPTQVAHLGIVRCTDHARYQSVLTATEHRGQGLASHLLAVAGAWAGGQGARRWRIVVDPGTPAARLYRCVGFAFEAVSWQVTAE